MRALLKAEKIAQVRKEREVVIQAMEKLPPHSPVRQTLISPNGFDATHTNEQAMTVEEKARQIESSMLEMVSATEVTVCNTSVQ